MLERIDDKNIPTDGNELRLFALAHNESLRLPYFLKHYRELGVDRFFILDNESTDETRKILLKEDDVHVFNAIGPYKHKQTEWITEIVSTFCQEWCVIVDIDEFLVSTRPLKYLCEELDEEGANVYRTFLLDMYSDKPISETIYKEGDNPFEIAPFYDDVDYSEALDYAEFPRGLRKRVFNLLVTLRKATVVKYNKLMVINTGQHTIDGYVIHSKKSGILCHFKYFSDFLEVVPREVSRDRYHAPHDWRHYLEGINNSENLILFDPKVSKRFSLNTLDPEKVLYSCK